MILSIRFWKKAGALATPKGMIFRLNTVFQNEILTLALGFVGPSEASTASSSEVKAHQVQNPHESLIPVSAYIFISLKEHGTHHKGRHIEDLLYNLKNRCMARRHLGDH